MLSYDETLIKDTHNNTSVFLLAHIIELQINISDWNQS